VRLEIYVEGEYHQGEIYIEGEKIYIEGDDIYIEGKEIYVEGEEDRGDVATWPLLATCTGLLLLLLLLYYSQD